MVRRIRFIYGKSILGFQKNPDFFCIAPEGSRRSWSRDHFIWWDHMGLGWPMWSSLVAHAAAPYRDKIE
jgi:hypothetical protein